MKHSFLFCSILVSLLCASCAEQSDDPSGEAGTQNNLDESPLVVDVDSIRKSELNRLLLNRFRCYVIRQSLTDGDELSPEDICCLCKTEQQEKVVFKTAQETISLNNTVQLEQALAKMNAEELPVVSQLDDTAAFSAFWTDSIFASPAELKKFRVRRDSSKTFAAFKQTLQKEMIADYPALYDSAGTYASRIAENILEEKKSDGAIAATQTTENPAPTSYWPMVAAGISCALSLITLVIVFDWKRSRRKAHDKKNEHHQASFADFPDQIESINESVKNLEKNVAQLKEWKATLPGREKSQTAAKEFNSSFSPANEVPLEIIKTPSPLRLLFFSSPNSDGSFQNSSGRNEAVPGASIYRFELVNETTAHFTAVDSADAAHLALGTPENALKPACDYLNIPPRVEQIVTDSPGTARLEGTTWKVTQKAKISFR